MFWTDNGQPARIEKAAMDGTNRRVVITFDFDTSPTGLTIDSNGWLLFMLAMNFQGWNIPIITMIPSHNNRGGGGCYFENFVFSMEYPPENRDMLC